jgi:hypothetical protein
MLTPVAAGATTITLTAAPFTSTSRLSSTTSTFTFNVSRSVSTVSYPVGVAVDSSRNIYVVNSLLDGSPNGVTKYDTTGVLQWRKFTDSTTLAFSNVAVDATTGNIYLTSWDYHDGKEYDSSGTEIGSGFQTSNPAGIAVSASGVYVADYHDKWVTEFISQVASSPTIGLTGTPTGIAVDTSTNRTYVSLDGSANAEEFDSSGGRVTTFNGPSDTTGVAAAGGKSYFSHSASSPHSGIDSVMEYDSVGTSVSSFHITNGLSNPKAVAVDAQGNIYVANSGNNTVTEYDSSGTLQLTIY